MSEMILKRCCFLRILFLLKYLETFQFTYLFNVCLPPVECELHEDRHFIFGAPWLESSVKEDHKNLCPSNSKYSWNQQEVHQQQSNKEIVTVLLSNCENLVTKENQNILAWLSLAMLFVHSQLPETAQGEMVGLQNPENSYKHSQVCGETDRASE